MCVFQIEDETVHQQNEFDFSKLQFITKQDEPYDTEDLNMVPGGYRYVKIYQDIVLEDCEI